MPINFSQLQHAFVVYTDDPRAFEIIDRNDPDFFIGDSIVTLKLARNDDGQDVLRIETAGYSQMTAPTPVQAFMTNFVTSLITAVVADTVVPFLNHLSAAIPDDIPILTTIPGITVCWSDTHMDWMLETFDPDTMSAEDDITLPRAALGLLGYVIVEVLHKENLFLAKHLVSVLQYMNALSFQSPNWKKESKAERLGLKLIVNPDLSEKA